MKIAHISDIHYSPKKLKWVDKAMVASVDRAIAEECAACIISGDSFDHQMGSHEPAFIAFVRQIARISEHMPPALLYGTNSHDRPGSLDVFREMHARHPMLIIDEPGVWLLIDSGVWLQYREGENIRAARLMLCALPSLNKAATEIAEHGAAYYVGNVMKDFVIATDMARAVGVPSVLVTHGTVVGCITESKYAMVSPDHEFTTDLLYSAGADAVMIGHIHAQQEWRK